MNVYNAALDIFVCLCLFLQTGTSVFSEGNGHSPSFDVPVMNVTATSGTTAILPCTINDVGENMVAWMDPRKKLLTLVDKRIITDQRISVERPYTKDWNLHVRNVRQNDSGEYLCQVNTEPVKSKKINLIVTEPPAVVETSGDQSVREGDTVSLWCKVTGVPYPEVTWWRKHSHNPHEKKKEIGSSGEELKIYNISRFCEDDYECVADNGISYPASQTIRVTVQFAPEVSLYTNKISQRQGKETMLDCKIAANPHGYMGWKRGGQEIANTGKYGISVYEDDRYTKTLSLRIGRLDDRDYGKYKCFAQNVFGDDQEDMMLYELKEYRPPTTTTQEPSTYTWRHNGKKNNDINKIYVNQNNIVGATPRYSPGNADAARGRTGVRINGFNSSCVHRSFSLWIVTLMVYLTLAWR